GGGRAEARHRRTAGRSFARQGVLRRLPLSRAGARAARQYRRSRTCHGRRSFPFRKLPRGQDICRACPAEDAARHAELAARAGHHQLQAAAPLAAATSQGRQTMAKVLALAVAGTLASAAVLALGYAAGSRSDLAVAALATPSASLPRAQIEEI